MEGTEADEGGDGDRWPKSRGGGSMLAELVSTLIVAGLSVTI